MWGYLFALLAAMLEASKTIFSKQGLKELNIFVVAWASRFFPLFFLIPLLLITKIPQIGDRFWPTLGMVLVLDTIGSILYMAALKASDISITVPMVAFTPLIMLVSGPMLLGEFPSLIGLVGIVTVVIGSYLLNISKKTQGILSPFRALLKEKGPRLMLLLAAVWAFTASFHKIGVLNSSPVFWTVSVHLGLTLTLLPLMLLQKGKPIGQVISGWKVLVPIGSASALAIIAQNISLQTVLAVYTISIKRTSILFSILLSWFVFKEKNIKQRLAAASIMVLGAILITIYA